MKLITTLALVVLFNVSAFSQLTYRASLSQTGTSSPTADVVENQLGSITFERVQTGLYRAVPATTFPSGKLLVRLNSGGATSVIHSAYLYDGAIWIETLQLRFNVQSGQSVFTYTDNGLYESFFEILIYTKKQ